VNHKQLENSLGPSKMVVVSEGLGVKKIDNHIYCIYDFGNTSYEACIFNAL